MNHKRCGKRAGCGRVLPVSEFNKQKGTRDGLKSRCRSCTSGADRDYHARMPAEVRERKRAATLAHQKDHPEQTAARVRRWNRENPDRAHAAAKRYRDGHPLEERLRGGRLRAEQLGVRADHITPDDLLADWQRRGIDPERCVYTGEPLQDGWHLDHAYPLSRAGTPGHVVQNLVPTNVGTNASKGRRHFVEYLADRAVTTRATQGAA